MTDMDFQRVMKVLSSLYPKIGAEMNDEQSNVWRIALGSFEADRCISSIRDWAASRQKWPRPADIRSFLSANTVVNSGDARAAEQRRREEIEEDIRRRDDTIAQLDDDALARHKASALAHDWRLRYIADRDPRKAPGWKAVIALRVWAGFGPDDMALDEVPPESQGKRGNVGGAMRKLAGGVK